MPSGVYTARFLSTVMCAMAGKASRQALSLSDKVKLIKDSDGKSCRVLAKEYDISKTQASDILKRKAEFLMEFEGNKNSKRIRLSTNSVYEELNQLVWKWFQRARSLGVPVSGPMVQEQALRYAQELNFPDFKASNGWLDRWRKRNNVSWNTVCGEANSVSSTDVTTWKEKLPSLVNGYAARDIFNFDETGMFYRALPDKTFTVKGQDCKGGKRSKERLTAALCVNLEGEFERPFVIGKAARPRCFKNLSLDCLPVKWTSNRKAWMTTLLFEEWIRSLDRRMRLQRRNILLFLDNASSHKVEGLSNIKIIFFPPNTTSHLQPLDQGIIQVIKVHYRKLLLRHVLSLIETGTNAVDIAKSINVLNACHWIAQAQRTVKPGTVRKCFYKAGFHNPAHVDGTPPAEESSASSGSELADLVHQASQRLHLAEPMSAEEYCNIDEGLPTVDELDAGWEDRLVEEVKGADSACASDCEEADQDPKADLSPPAISTCSQAIKCANDLLEYLAYSANTTLHCQMTSIRDELNRQLVISKRKARQTTMDSFLQVK